MIKRGDYIIIDEFGYKSIGKVVFAGQTHKDIRSITILPIYPFYDKELYSVVVDVRKVVILNVKQTEFVKCVYE